MKIYFFSKERGQFGPKLHVKGVVPINHFSCQKTRWMGLLYGM